MGLHTHYDFGDTGANIRDNQKQLAKGQIWNSSAIIERENVVLRSQRQNSCVLRRAYSDRSLLLQNVDRNIDSLISELKGFKRRLCDDRDQAV
jgi:hypothetical protein